MGSQFLDKRDESWKCRDAPSGHNLLYGFALRVYKTSQFRRVDISPRAPESGGDAVAVVHADVTLYVRAIVESQPQGLENMLVRCVMDPFGVHQDAVAVENNRVEMVELRIQICPNLMQSSALLCDAPKG